MQKSLSIFDPVAASDADSPPATGSARVSACSPQPGAPSAGAHRFSTHQSDAGQFDADGAAPAADRSASGSAIPARLRIVAWIVLTTLLGLAALVLTVRTALLNEVANEGNADVVQEIEEFGEFISEGRNPETAQPFTSTESMLDVYLRRQRLGSGEVLLGYLRSTDEVIATRQSDASDPNSYELSQDGNLLRIILDSDSRSGVATSAIGEVRWGRVEIAANQTGDRGGALLVASFTRRGTAQVDETTRLIIGVGFGALILVSGIAWLVAGQILRPVRTVRQAAAQITERDLTRRIPVQGRDDVAALATTFNGMLDRLEDAFAMQRRFVDDAGHELRTPITIVYGHLELLSEDPQERHSTILLVLDELARMGRIVSDLLVLAKAERPDFVQLEEVDIAELTFDIDSLVQVLANRRWTLAHVADGLAKVDAQRVTQAVLQFAQNAVQHTRDGSEIRISSEFREDESGPVVDFSVRDFGPGVRASDAAMIFDRFAHGSASDHATDRPGAGLGLAIVRAIASAHGGEAYVHSTPGAGATFGITLPARMALADRHDAREPQ